MPSAPSTASLETRWIRQEPTSREAVSTAAASQSAAAHVQAPRARELSAMVTYMREHVPRYHDWMQTRRC